jgi:hypothetical protein
MRRLHKESVATVLYSVKSTRPPRGATAGTAASPEAKAAAPAAASVAKADRLRVECDLALRMSLGGAWRHQ